jgi:hypothetical protein
LVTILTGRQKKALLPNLLFSLTIPLSVCNTVYVCRLDLTFASSADSTTNLD